MTLVWVTMLIGLVIIWKFIVPLSYPSNSYLITFLISTFKVGVSGILAFIWLYLWNKLVKTYFWKTLRGNRDNE